jgi:hypothetical protein
VPLVWFTSTIKLKLGCAVLFELTVYGTWLNAAMNAFGDVIIVIAIIL